jgi:uncharacterized repeat protein (TIGR02543 family)
MTIFASNDSSVQAKSIKSNIFMKKHYSLLLAFLVAFSSLFVSCDENDDFEDLNRCKVTVTCTEGGKVKISKYLETTEIVLFGSEIEVVATADEGYAFTGWYLGDSTEPVSTDAVFTFVATRNTTLTAHFAKDPNIINGHECVDLGLPSGLKWATCNVGASAPEEYGGYYAWGETVVKNDYSWSTYKWCNGSSNTMTKYCTSSSYGTIDNKTTLDPEDDVAHVKWGGSWRMPTEAEQDELHNNCMWTWTTQNGVKGYKVTGPNDNSIFLPAAGYRDGTDLSYSGDYGYCLSGSLYGGNNSSAYNFYFNNGFYIRDIDYRCYGLSVRPVSE